MHLNEPRCFSSVLHPNGLRTFCECNHLLRFATAESSNMTDWHLNFLRVTTPRPTLHEFQKLEPNRKGTSVSVRLKIKLRQVVSIQFEVVTARLHKDFRLCSNLTSSRNWSISKA